MKYTYRIEHLDCMNCATKIENAISKINGVASCTINFFTLKLTLETKEELTETLLKAIQKAVKRIEPDVKISKV